MADIKLNVVGEDNASAAMKSASDSTKALGESIAKETVKWQEMADLAKEGARSIYEFGVESVKAFMATEKAQRQLTLVAKGLGQAFADQADVLEKSLAVDGDKVMAMQAMLLRFGEAPSKVQATVRALLDYSAATGKDALQSTEELTRGVETGRAAFQALGLQYKATGRASADLELATSALAKKVGGAAKADADSVEGAARKTAIAFDDMKKAFGSLIVEFASQTGVVDRINRTLKSLMQTLQGDQSASFQAGLAARKHILEQAKADLERVRNDAHTGVTELEMAADALKYAEEAYTNFAKHGTESGPGGVATPSGFSDRETMQGQRSVAARASANEQLEALYAKNAADFRNYTKTMDDMDQHLADVDQKAIDDELKAQQAGEQATMAERDKQADLDAAWYQKQWQALKDEKDKETALVKQKNDEQLQAMQKQRQDFANAAGAIGAAFVNALSTELDKLASGQEMDLGESIGNILASVLQVAGSVIGSYFGPAGSAIGGAVGQLAGVGIRYATRSHHTQPTTYHEGGWAGIPRFHSGGGYLSGDELPAVLQTGERVLSRSEVSNMGGPAGVDRATRGGPGLTLVVHAMDALGVKELFEDRGGRGFERAVKSGRGDLARLLGAGLVY